MCLLQRELWDIFYLKSHAALGRTTKKCIPKMLSFFFSFVMAKCFLLHFILILEIVESKENIKQVEQKLSDFLFRSTPVTETQILYSISQSE